MTDTISSDAFESRSWRERGRSAAQTPIARGSAWILASTVIGAIGGALFWVAAARTATTAQVGTAAALFSLVGFVNYLTGLGLPVMVARYGGDHTDDSRVLYNWAIVITVAGSCVATMVCLPFARAASSALYGWGYLPGVAFFGALAAGAAVGQLVDMRLTVQRRWHWVTVRIAVYSLLGLPLLLLVAHTSAFIVFAVAAGLPALAGVTTWWLADGDHGRLRLRPVPQSAGAAFRCASVNCVSLLAVQAPVFVLPVIVLAAVAPTENATFFIAWSFATTIFLLPLNVTKVLLAEGGTGRDLARQTRLALGLNAIVGVGAAIAVVIGSRFVTVVYGPSYSKSASLLIVLAIATVPWAVTAVALTHSRVIEDASATIMLSAVYATSVLVPSFILVHTSGTSGAAQGCLAGNAATAIVAGVWLSRKLREARVDQDTTEFPERPELAIEASE